MAGYRSQVKYVVALDLRPICLRFSRVNGNEDKRVAVKFCFVLHLYRKNPLLTHPERIPVIRRDGGHCSSATVVSYSCSLNGIPDTTEHGLREGHMKNIISSASQPGSAR